MWSELGLKISKEMSCWSQWTVHPNVGFGQLFGGGFICLFALFYFFFSVLFSFSAFSKAAGTVMGLL